MDAGQASSGIHPMSVVTSPRLTMPYGHHLRCSCDTRRPVLAQVGEYRQMRVQVLVDEGYVDEHEAEDEEHRGEPSDHPQRDHDTGVPVSDFLVREVHHAGEHLVDFVLGHLGQCVLDLLDRRVGQTQVVLDALVVLDRQVRVAPVRVVPREGLLEVAVDMNEPVLDRVELELLDERLSRDSGQELAAEVASEPHPPVLEHGVQTVVHLLLGGHRERDVGLGMEPLVDGRRVRGDDLVEPPGADEHEARQECHDQGTDEDHPRSDRPLLVGLQAVGPVQALEQSVRERPLELVLDRVPHDVLHQQAGVEPFQPGTSEVVPELLVGSQEMPELVVGLDVKIDRREDVEQPQERYHQADQPPGADTGTTPLPVRAVDPPCREQNPEQDGPTTEPEEAEPSFPGPVVHSFDHAVRDQEDRREEREELEQRGVPGVPERRPAEELSHARLVLALVLFASEVLTLGPGCYGGVSHGS